MTTGLILLYLTGSVFQVRGLQGKGPLQVSAATFLDTGTIQQLGLQLTSVGGKVIQVAHQKIVVLTKSNRRLQVEYGAKTIILEGSTKVPPSTIDVGAHIATQALPLGSTYLAVKTIHLTPHYRSIGGQILSTHGVLTLQSRHNGIALVRLLPGATISLDGSRIPFRFPLSAHMQVVARAYPDPFEAGVYRTTEVRVLATTVQTRVGGLITAIDTKNKTLKVFSRTLKATYTIEILSSTKISLSKYTATIDDMSVGDHVTVTGKLDVLHLDLGPNPLLAKIIRIGSPSFGGTIIDVAASTAGGVRLTLKARHHVLTIDAPTSTLVYALVAGTQQTAHVLNLAVGEHIAVKGTRVGKFEMIASSIHVYPHQHTVGGVAAIVQPGQVRMTTSTDSQYIVQLTSQTTYSLNGQKIPTYTLRAGLHIRVRGYDSLADAPHSTPTLIAAHVSVTIHVTTVKKKGTPAPPKKTPKKKTISPPTALQILVYRPTSSQPWLSLTRSRHVA
jgi:hypothetical protein